MPYSRGALKEAFTPIAEQVVPPNGKQTPALPEENVLILGPETVIAHKQTPLDSPGRPHRLKAKRVKHNAPAPEPAPPAAINAPAPLSAGPEAAEPEVPAPQIPTPPEPKPAITLHTFRWKGAIITRSVKAKPAQALKPFQYRAFQTALPVVPFPGQTQAVKYHPR